MNFYSVLQLFSGPSPLNFFVNAILTCYCGSLKFELCHIFEGFIIRLNILISPSILMTRHDCIYNLVSFHFSTNHFAACDTDSVLSLQYSFFFRPIN